MQDWNSDMVIDHGVLDEDHHRTHELIRRFLALPAEDDQRLRAIALLERLRDLSIQHFMREEKVQIAIRYPLLNEHRAQHRRMIVLLGEIIEQVEARESVFPFGYIKTQTDQLLPHWFLEHFTRADLPLKLHIAKTPTVMKALAR
ncbi:bacteriohemerythrin [Azospirillum griseum]|uniref:Hemerythrin-like metal-binding protein n=1 Tax=Azospirillum griseum TaxID=2496639 RepID=A0A431VG60_9PROT|nr:hemerythrin family protein [Azospirillum griseum]RTR19160.1 hemerythrin-like metal-binding protein [Azospirillum griseum]